MHKSLVHVTTAPHHQGLAGTLLSFQQIPAKSPALQGQTDGKISAIRPCSAGTKELVIISTILAQKQNHPIHPALRGQADSKIPVLFSRYSRPSPWGGRGQ